MGKRWQVTFDAEKTQATLFSRRQDAVNKYKNINLLEGRNIYLQESVNILEFGFDTGLTFTKHVKKITKDAAWKLSCVRRIAHILDVQGVDTLYNS